MTTKNDKAKDSSSLLHGFLAFHAVYAVTIGISLLFLIGSFLFPRSVGLFLVLPYYTYSLSIGRHEVKDGARWRSFSRNFVLIRFMRKFLQLSLFKPLPKELEVAEKAPNAQFLLAVYPHGTGCEYRLMMDGMLHEAFPNLEEKIFTLTATIIFRIPLIRELALLTGCVDARRSVAEKALDKGRTLLVLPGGEAEQIRTIYGREIIYLKRRKGGFIKLAMQKGVPIIPTYVFGASDYFYTSHALFGPREWLRKNLGVCIPLAIGQWGSIFCPRPVKTTIVFGKPLSFEVKDRGSPSDEELDVAHSKFCASLQELFDEHKKLLGYCDRELEIV